MISLDAFHRFYPIFDICIFYCGLVLNILTLCYYYFTITELCFIYPNVWDDLFNFLLFIS